MTTTETTSAEARPDIAATREQRLGVLVPGPAALERVAGVEIARRAAIVLRRAGCSRVLVRGTADPVHALAEDPRVGPLGPLDSAALDAEGVALVVGDVTFPVALIDEMVSDPDSRERGAFVSNDSGLVLVAPPSVAREVLGPETSSLAEMTVRARAASKEVRIDTLRPGSTKKERRAASRAILRATAKAVDGPLTRLFDRRISQAISAWLIPWPISPNVMTTVSCVIGLTGASLLATTEYGLRIVGAALFVLATIVDGCDGEIARSKFLESRFGKLYDTGVDLVVNAAVFIGIGVGTWRELNGVADVRMATLMLVVGSFLAMAVAESGRRLAPVADPRSILGRAQAWLERFATFEWSYLVLVLAALDGIPFFFFGAAVGANVFTVVYLVLGVLAWRRT